MFNELIVGDNDGSNKLVKMDKQSQKPVNITLFAGGTILNFLVKGELGCFHCMKVYSDLVYKECAIQGIMCSALSSIRTHPLKPFQKRKRS